ncbi:MAG: hypothetical protein ACI8WB_006165 [Phenylobacterium sp.]|jgi:hypothetical protein
MPKPKIGKNKQKKIVKPVFHIFCEGKKTEPYYLRGYIDRYHSDNKSLLVVEQAKKNTPIALVKEAIAHKDTGNPRDVYWVVFDRESVTKYKHTDHLEAQNQARSHDIQIAFSNVCFEYWFLLHFEFSAAGYDCCDDLLKNSPLKQKLADRGIKKYDKGIIYLFDKLKENNGINNALTNGARIKKQALASAERGRESPCYLNPYTDVHELLIDMKNFVDTKESVRTNSSNINMPEVLIEMRRFIDSQEA